MPHGTASDAVKYVSAQTTVDSSEDAEKLAAAVVDAGLAACVQVSQVRSFYHWEGAVQDDPEFLLSIKTTSQTVPSLQELLERRHPYDEPEFIVLPIIGGSQSYLQWVAETTGGG